MTAPRPVQEFFSIGEVCALTDLKPHVLRYWESQFRFLSTSKNRSGNRVYKSREVELILLVKHLLYTEKFTIEGARQRLETYRRSGELKGAAQLAASHETLRELREMTEQILAILDGRRVPPRPAREPEPEPSAEPPALEVAAARRIPPGNPEEADELPARFAAGGRRPQKVELRADGTKTPHSISQRSSGTLFSCPKPRALVIILLLGFQWGFPGEPERSAPPLPDSASALQLNIPAPLINNVEEAFARIQVYGEYLAAHANGLIPKPWYSTSFRNWWGFRNHFQVMRRLPNRNYLVLSGSNTNEPMANLFIIRLS